MTAVKQHRPAKPRRDLGSHIAARGEGSDAPWIDYRASLARVDRRCDPPTCDVCGCELDVRPVPHKPGCPESA